MRFTQLHRIFVLSPMVLSLLYSCRLSSEVNKISMVSSPIEVTASPTGTSTEEPVFVLIPKPYLSPEEFVGYYTASFEVSSFVPCSENDAPGPAKGYWIDIFRSPSFIDKYDALVAEIIPSENQVKETRIIVFVRFIGQRSNPLYEAYSIEGRRGHMGLYKQEIVVTELIEMKAMEDNQCDGL